VRRPGNNLQSEQPAMLFSERRYDFSGVCDPIFGIRLGLWIAPKCFVAHHPKYRVTALLGGNSSAYHLSENNMPAW